MKKPFIVMMMIMALALSTMAGAIADAHFGITSPTAEEGERALVAPGEDVFLGAIGPDTGGVQWAVRRDTCDPSQPTAITIAGNVDGRNDVATYEDGVFSFTLAADRLQVTDPEAGEFYCFVFNPYDAGRYLQEFLVVGTDATKDICKDGGWKDWADPSFRNQGACVSYFQANPNASFDTFGS